MYMTWELFFTFCGVILQLITLIVCILKNNDHHNDTKKK